MVQWIEHLSCNCKDLSLKPEHLGKARQGGTNPQSQSCEVGDGDSRSSQVRSLAKNEVANHESLSPQSEEHGTTSEVGL